MKRILVTGGAGFLGTNLCRKLLNETDDYIICLDNLYTGTKENIEDLLNNNRFEFVQHDIIEPIDINVDEIYNLACPASPPHYQKDHIFTLKTCFLGVMNMLDLAKKYNAKFLQTSTSEVYGDPDPKIKVQPESYWGNVNCNGLRSCYDEGKRVGESLIFNYNRMYGINVKIVRIFNTYGPYMDVNDGRVISNFITQCLTGKPITIYGDGHQTRSICYVDDLIEAIVRMMHSEDGFIGPVNIGNQEEYTVKELAEWIKKLTNSKSEIVYCEAPKDDPMQRCPDISLAKKKLNWAPNVSSHDGLIKTIEYFAKKVGR